MKSRHHVKKNIETLSQKKTLKQMKHKKRKKRRGRRKAANNTVRNWV
jgi:hypothetical protein